MQESKKQTKAVFVETVRPSVIALLPAVLLIPAIWLVLAPFNPTLGFVLGTIASVIAMLLALRTSTAIAITKDQFTVGKANIARKHIQSAVVIVKSEQFLQRGPKLDARAFLALRSSASGLVKVTIRDKADPTPYWLISTNRAEELAEALNSGR